MLGAGGFYLYKQSNEKKNDEKSKKYADTKNPVKEQNEPIQEIRIYKLLEHEVSPILKVEVENSDLCGEE